MFSVKNSFDTVVQSEISTFLDTLEQDWIDIGVSIFGGVDALKAYEEEILSTGGAIQEWEQSWDGFFNKMERNIDKIAIAAGALVYLMQSKKAERPTEQHS
jgi:hypothetical protein